MFIHKKKIFANWIQPDALTLGIILSSLEVTSALIFWRRSSYLIKADSCNQKFRIKILMQDSSQTVLQIQALLIFVLVWGWHCILLTTFYIECRNHSLVCPRYICSPRPKIKLLPFHILDDDTMIMCESPFWLRGLIH